MIEPYYETALGKLYHGDCLTIMPQLEPVDLVVTSPPYNVKKEYEKKQSDEDYHALLNGFVLGLSHWVMGYVVINTNDQLCSNNGVVPVHQIFHDSAVRSGFEYFDRRIWVKDPAWMNNPWCGSSYKSVDEFEYLYIYRNKKTPYKRERLSGMEWKQWGSRGVWKMRSVRSNDSHPAEFTAELPFRFIRLFTDENDIVGDPFCGRGTTPFVCEKLKRRWIGIEKEESHCESAAKRIENETRQLKLF